MLVISFIGHATLLIEVAGVRILTDPNFDTRLGGVLRRVAAPVPSLAALQRPDAILVSHAHADHLSVASLFAIAEFRREPIVPIYAPPAVARSLARRKLAARAASPLGGREARKAESQKQKIEKPKVESRKSTKSKDSGEDRFQVWPAKSATAASHAVTVYVGAAEHQGSRYGFDRWGGRGDANTYLIDSGVESVFFAGDTGLTGDSHELVARVLGPAGRRLDVALLPIGYSPWWKPGFRRNHLSPADALTLFDRLDARVLIPYHWGTFHHLSSGPFDAVRQFEEALIGYPRRADVKVVPPGSRVVIEPPADRSANATALLAEFSDTGGAGR
jgi:L-ascorbate metabolism protein UlaG (beta-lactamase superfamily)